MANLLVNAGRAILTSLMVASDAMYVGWGIGTGTSAATDTSLFTEDYSTYNDGVHNIRPAGVQTQYTQSVLNDTYQLVCTLYAYAAQTITNYGVFDSNGQAPDLLTAPSGGTMILKADFAPISLRTGDKLTITTRLTF